MDILQLKYFCEVAESLHVTNSAKKLHIAQPSLTQTIHRLENELGVKLFKSKGRNIVLTEYGEFLKKEIAPAVRAIDEIPLKLTEMAELNRNTITINVQAASNAVIKSIVKFREINNDVRIKIIQNKESSSADIIIFTEPAFENPYSREDTYVFTEKIFLAVPDNELYRSLECIPLSKFKDSGFISLAGSKQLRQMCDKFCMMSGFTPNIIFESDSPHVVRDMIGMNLGVGFWPQYSWGEDNGNHVRLIPISSPLCQRDIIIKCNYSAHRGNSDKVRELFESIINYFESIQL